jgi:hypothetical protein
MPSKRDEQEAELGQNEVHAAFASTLEPSPNGRVRDTETIAHPCDGPCDPQ